MSSMVTQPQESIKRGISRLGKKEGVSMWFMDFYNIGVPL
jgi:hypothetical protein